MFPLPLTGSVSMTTFFHAGHQIRGQHSFWCLAHIPVNERFVTTQAGKHCSLWTSVLPNPISVCVCRKTKLQGPFTSLKTSVHYIYYFCQMAPFVAGGTGVLDLGVCRPQVIYEFSHFVNVNFFFKVTFTNLYLECSISSIRSAGIKSRGPVTLAPVQITDIISHYRCYRGSPILDMY